MSSDQAAAKGKANKPQRATTGNRNRADSPPPYRSTDSTSIQDFANEFWQHAMNVAEHHPDDFKHQALPLARIKKVAKMDPELQNQMISSEVTVLFEKACQIFIQELTARAHLRSLASRRRMISRADVAAAVSRSDMFDFLIDIVPRPERSPSPVPAPHTNDQQQETYSQAGPSYSAAYGDASNSNNNSDGAPIASTSAATAERDDTGYQHHPPPLPQSSRPTRSSARSRRYSERDSDFETEVGGEYRGGGGGEASEMQQQHMLDLGQPPPPTRGRRGQRSLPEKRRRVEIPGAGEELLGAVGGPTDEVSTSTSVPSTSTTTATTTAPSLTIPVSLGGGGGGPPHLHPTGLPNPNLGPQPGSAPAPIVDAETLRQAYAAVAGSMPPGLFMPHTLIGAMPMQQQQSAAAAQRGEGDDGGAGVAEGGGGRPMPWPPAFGFPGADGGSVTDGLGNFYAQGMDDDDEEQRDLDQHGGQAER
ncbi:hypothetical protein RHOSPDRAFT_33244 [Rhodotorula sp. JG-1b]|nr:hypothetical protein RHOSPDRAFT_33244 [Rhodotorula sp. JG-1b]